MSNKSQPTLDRFSYIEIYAPRFPEEDQTTLQREFDELRNDLLEIAAKTRTKSRQTWLNLALRETESAFLGYLRGDEDSGCKSVQRAHEHFKKYVRREPTKARFLVGPDGTTEHQ